VVRTSVVLPVHNAAATVGETIASVQSQTTDDWELIIVCNGCTDDSIDIARAAATSDSRIRVDILVGASVVDASNLALELSRAPLMARIDADDVMPRHRLASQSFALSEHPNWAVCTGGVEHGGDPDGGMQRHVDWLNSLESPTDVFHQRFVESPIANPSVMVRTAVLRELGGYRNGEFAEDYDLWLRLLEAGHHVGRVDESVLWWRDSPTRLTRSDPRYSVDSMRGLKHRYLLRGPLKHGGRVCRVWGSGPYGKQHAKGLRSLGVRVEAFIDVDPRKIGGQAAGGIPVRAPDVLGCPDGVLTLIAVATPGAREEISEYLDALGHQVERDYLAVQ
jgi:glycosyltransferase involved in cell wall biosynthesis